MIYLSRPSIDFREITAVRRVLRSGWLSSGSDLKDLEQKFAAFIGVKYAVSLNSCASALQLAIQALGLKGEIILPSFTFVASANAVVNAGCIPRFVDIVPGTCNMDPSRLEGAINQKTVAVMPVHFAGQSCDMARLDVIAKKHGLAVIEDSAEAVGATFNGRKTGAFGMGCFSFFSTKNMTCGEGGMVTTDSACVRDKILAYASHGIDRSSLAKRVPPWYREARYPGFNYRMSNVLAAVAGIQLAKVEAMNKVRRAHAAFFNEKLGACDELELPQVDPRCYHVYQMYTVKIKAGKGLDRDTVVNLIRSKGVEASVHFFPPVHRQALYKKYVRSQDRLDVTDDVSRNIVSLPLYPSLTSRELNKVVWAVKKALRVTGK